MMEILLLLYTSLVVLLEVEYMLQSDIMTSQSSDAFGDSPSPANSYGRGGNHSADLHKGQTGANLYC